MGKENKKTAKKETNVKEEKATKKEAKEVAKAKVKKVEKKKDKKKDKKENIFKRIVGFFKGVKSEMSKVAWPSRKHMVKYSITTICLIIFFALYFLGIMALFDLIKEFFISVL